MQNFNYLQSKVSDCSALKQVAPFEIAMVLVMIELVFFMRAVMVLRFGFEATTVLIRHWPEGCPMPCGVMVSNNSWGKAGGRGDIWSDGVCLPNKPLYVTSPALLGAADTCLPMGSREWVPCSAFLVHGAFGLPSKLSLS